MEMEFTDANFAQEAKGSPTLVMIDFYAPWCGPCKMMAPVVDALAKERTDVKIGKLNVDENPNTSTEFGVSSIPTTIFMKGGTEVGRVVGFQSREALEKKIAEFA